MREKILEYLTQYPGSRKRYIAGAIGVWLCDSEFMHMMHELEDEGLIYYETYKDPAQMELYDKWYVKT